MFVVAEEFVIWMLIWLERLNRWLQPVPEPPPDASRPPPQPCAMLDVVGVGPPMPNTVVLAAT